MNNDPRDGNHLDETVTIERSEPALTVDLEATQQTPLRAPKPLAQVAVDQTVLDPAPLDQTMALPIARPVQAQEPAPSPEQAHIATVLGGPLAPTVAVGPAVVWAPYAPVPDEGAEPLRELSPGEYLHFGPGVPVPSVSSTGQAGAIWRGDVAPEAEPRRRRWLLRGWLLPIIVLIVVLAILAWMRFGHPIAVTGAQARAQSTTIGCGDTATITGTLQTNGEAGTVSYQWQRSDGTQSAVLQQRFAKGTHQVNVALLWTFSGDGNIHATATLDVLSPNAVSASTSFTYTCE